MMMKTGLWLVIAIVLSLAVANGDAQAFWGSRGSYGSCGSSGGSYGSGGSWGSCGSHGGLFSRVFNGSHGSYGSYGSHGSHGGYASCGSAGGYVVVSRGGPVYYASGQRQAGAVVAAQKPVVKTQLTLKVPAEAKVTLAGVETKQSGEVRQFSTTRLAAGQAWQNYQIVVELDRDGQTLREERTVTLTGGRAQELSIGFADTTLAQATR